MASKGNGGTNYNSFKSFGSA